MELNFKTLKTLRLPLSTSPSVKNSLQIHPIYPSSMLLTNYTPRPQIVLRSVTCHYPLQNFGHLPLQTPETASPIIFHPNPTNPLRRLKQELPRGLLPINP